MGINSGLLHGVVWSEQGDSLLLGEGLIGNRREAPEPYCYALALVPGSRRA